MVHWCLLYFRPCGFRSILLIPHSSLVGCSRRCFLTPPKAASPSPCVSKHTKATVALSLKHGRWPLALGIPGEARAMVALGREPWLPILWNLRILLSESRIRKSQDSEFRIQNPESLNQTSTELCQLDQKRHRAWSIRTAQSCAIGTLGTRARIAHRSKSTRERSTEPRIQIQNSAFRILRFQKSEI